MRSRFIVLTCAAALAAASAGAVHAFGSYDFGLFREASSTRIWSSCSVSSLQLMSRQRRASVQPTRAADPTKLVTLAKGLQAHVVTAVPNAAPNFDMMVLWPNDQNPTHLIVANEEGSAQPALQRVRLSDGLVETILTGTTSNDPGTPYRLGHDSSWRGSR
jgi:hypothetical protein